MDHIINYLFIILDFIITISAIIIFLIYLNLVICPFLIYFFSDLLFNNLNTNTLCQLSDNQPASYYGSYSQNPGPDFTQGETTNIPAEGVSNTQGEQGEREHNNTHNTPASTALLSTGIKGFYKTVVNKTRRRFYGEAIEIDKNNYNNYND